MTDERHHHHGPGVWPLVLIVGTIAFARHMGRHHGMGPGGRRIWMSDGPGSEGGSWLPPRLKAKLDAWHAEAHRTADSTESDKTLN